MNRALLILLVVVAAVGCRKASGIKDGIEASGSDREVGDRKVATDTAQTMPDNGDTQSESIGELASDTEALDSCAPVIHPMARVPVNVLIMLDRSGSMRDVAPNGDSFEVVVDRAITSMVTDPINSNIRFGLTAFPSSACVTNAIVPEEQCYAADELLVPIGSENKEAIGDALAALNTCGGTPMCASLDFAVETIDALLEDLLLNPTFLLLATDGAPNCNTAFDKEYTKTCIRTINGQGAIHGTQCLDDVCAIGAAKALYESGTEMFVVGVGETVGEWADTLSAIAGAGSGGARKYFPANGDEEELSGVLSRVISETTPCAFQVAWDELSGVTGDTMACDRVAVAATGTDGQIDIPFSDACADPGGWHWKGDSPVDQLTEPPLCNRIALCEKSCEALRNGDLTELVSVTGCLPGAR